MKQKAKEDNFETLLSSNERAAKVLGYMGLIPFVSLMAVLWIPFEFMATFKPFILDAFLLYSAIILSFLGGIHWGQTLSLSYPPPFQLIYSVIPSMLAWVGFLLPAFIAIIVFIGSFLWQWFIDRELYEIDWFVRLRTHLTLVVVLCLFLAGLNIVVT